jgi:hypothetical protein
MKALRFTLMVGVEDHFGEVTRLLRNSVAISAATDVRLSRGFLTWLPAARFYPASKIGMAAAISATIRWRVVAVDIARTD